MEGNGDSVQLRADFRRSCASALDVGADTCATRLVDLTVVERDLGRPASK